MEIVEHEEIIGQRIVLGRKRYVHCRFERCDVVFDGSAPENNYCTFHDCVMHFEGAAVHTVQYLRTLWVSGGRHIVEQFGRDYAGLPLRFGDE